MTFIHRNHRAGRRGRHPLPRAPRDPTGRQEGEPPTLTPFPRPKAAPDGAPDGNQANRPRKEGRWTRRRWRRRSPRWRTPLRIFQGHLENRAGHRKNDAGGYQSRDRHPQRASRHVTHDACPQPDAPERALAPSIASAMRPSACNACKALDEDVASLRGCEGAARRP